MRVVLLHAYSARNAGDGLLVRETLGLVHEALGEAVEVTVVASRPETFTGLGVRVVGSAPGPRGWDRELRAVLADLPAADLVLAVDGGYLRAGHPVEALKTALVHGPQLLAAARRGRGTVYLPQSIGPLGRGVLAGPLRALVVSRLRRVAHVLVRDDRSLAEVAAAGAVRVPDLALLATGARDRSGQAPDPVPVLTVRAVRGVLAPGLGVLAGLLGPVDGYVQSTTGGNDDTAAAAAIPSRRVLTAAELLEDPAAPRRVVVAVRLHAALMALHAGHLVVHLAYERKGFGAFDDLGLPGHVHPVGSFDPVAVAAQVAALTHDAAARAEYDARVAAARERLAGRRAELVALVRETAGVPAAVAR